MLRTAMALLALLMPAVAQTQVPITAREAASLPGDSVVVEDSVAQVFAFGDSTAYVLTFGGTYPDQVFYAMVPAPGTSFPDVSLWRGARVRVTGLVSVAADGPHIICQEPSQIELIQAAHWADPSPVAAPPPPTRTCCKICRTGKACGNSCISRSKTCRKGPGCACNG